MTKTTTPSRPSETLIKHMLRNAEHERESVKKGLSVTGEDMVFKDYYDWAQHQISGLEASRAENEKLREALEEYQRLVLRDVGAGPLVGHYANVKKLLEAPAQGEES